MSSQKSLRLAKRLQKRVSNDVYKFVFINLDTNNDSFVDMDELFNWLETHHKKWTKTELLDTLLERTLVFKKEQQKSVWNKPMDYETFKLYWTLSNVANIQAFYEVFDENKNGVLDNEEWNKMNNWSYKSLNFCNVNESHSKDLERIITSHYGKRRNKPKTLQRSILFNIESIAMSFKLTYCFQ